MEEAPLILRPVAGPHGEAMQINGDEPVTIGRAADCEQFLPYPSVSRRHAAVMRRNGTWFVRDLGSAHGTFLDGVRLDDDRPAALAPGDILRLGPCTFMVSIGGQGGGTTTLSRTIAADAPVGVAPASRVERVSDQELGAGAGRQLSLLIDCSSRLDQALSEEQMAVAAIEAALAGGGFQRGAVVRVVGDGREVEVLAARMIVLRQAAAQFAEIDPSTCAFSRSLIAEASKGHVARLAAPPGAAMLQEAARGTLDHLSSIAELGIHSALCVPLRLGESVSACLYLDARGGELKVRPDAAGFCEAVARIYGLALSKLKRQELEARQSRLESELSIAREAQLTLLPPPFGRVGVVEYASRVRPGLFVAGDMFDVVERPDGRVGVFLGDVAGHGIGAGILMATSQAFLHRAMVLEPDIGAAISSLNRYVASHSAQGQFLSLWAGIFGKDGEVEYVDAGHGHWMIVDDEGARIVERAEATGIPVGIDAAEAYTPRRLRLPGENRLVLYSDGVVEQRGASGEQFGVSGLSGALRRKGDRAAEVAGVFAALMAHAGSELLDDDATVAVLSLTA